MNRVQQQIGFWAIASLLAFSANVPLSSAQSAPPDCKGQTATIYVDGGTNTWVGGPFDGLPYAGQPFSGSDGVDDVIVGTDGDDVIEGKGGNDTICGGGGNDVVDGGAGNDLLCGNEGADNLDGKAGDDVICGDAGDDILDGKDGDDQLDGGAGSDILDGALGTDICANGETPIACEDVDVTPVDECTGTVSEHPGSITVIKDVTGAATPLRFDFDVNWLPDPVDFSLLDGEPEGSGDLMPGTYSVAEVNIPDGWLSDGGVCSDGSSASSIALGSNEDVTCTFTNTRAQCADGIDNDSDGRTDFAGGDPGCSAPSDNDENDTPPPPAPQCSDGIDNGDGEDSLADSADPGCHSDGNAGNSGSYDPNDTDESDTPAPLAPQCSDGIDNGDGEDSLADSADPGCHSDGNAGNSGSYEPSDNDETDPAPAPASSDGGGGGGGGGSRRRGGGGGGGSDEGEVLGAEISVCPLLRDYLHINLQNDPDQVNRAKAFFNVYMGKTLVLNGTFDQAMLAAVIEFQNTFRDEVLNTWVEAHPGVVDNSATGYIYQTTQWKINSIVCGQQEFPDELILAPVPVQSL